MADQQQSPINIHNAIYADFGSEGLSIPWAEHKEAVSCRVHKDHHGVKVEFASDERIFIKIGEKPFHLRQFHFHHPSEHWFDGKQHTLELHLVHENVDDGSKAVIGVFINVVDDADSLFPSLMTQADTILGTDTCKELECNASTNLRDFLPTTWKQHYRYHGSLTTPPYTENVSWVVVKDPLQMPVPIKLLELFRSEARFPQPLNRRFILKTFDAPKSLKTI